MEDYGQCIYRMPRGVHKGIRCKNYSQIECRYCVNCSRKKGIMEILEAERQHERDIAIEVEELRNRVKSLNSALFEIEFTLGQLGEKLETVVADIQSLVEYENQVVSQFKEYPQVYIIRDILSHTNDSKFEAMEDVIQQLECDIDYYEREAMLTSVKRKELLAKLVIKKEELRQHFKREKEEEAKRKAGIEARKYLLAHD